MHSIIYRGRFYRTFSEIVYNCGGDEMEDKKKTEMECHLTTRGSHEVDANVANDLDIDDPQPAKGKELIEEALNEEDEGKEDGQ